MHKRIADMLVDYTFETVRQADVYARLPDIGDHDINATGPHWYFELQPVNPETLPLFIQSRSTLAEAAGLNPDDFVDIVLSCPNLTRHQVRSSWPKSLLLGNQKAPVMNASNTILVWKLLSTFGTDWKKTIAEGQPFQPLTQSRPGHVHIRDVVVYRIIKQALLENGLKMKIVPDPNVALVGSSTAELHLRDSSAPMYCANTRCTVLGIPKGHCKRCSVAFYCSYECGTADWTAGHGLECLNIRELQIEAGLRPPVLEEDVPYSASSTNSSVV